MSTIAQRAIDLASNGMHIFPLRPNTKVPATQNGQNDSTTDIGQVTAWWKAMPTANIGIHCAPSGLYVVDVDCGNGKVGADSWSALVDRHGHVDTYTVQTWSGGWHFYYRMPAGESLTNTSGKLAKDIDTRGNGYVVSAGSVVNGISYKMSSGAPIATLPAWIADVVRKSPRPLPVPTAALEASFTAAAPAEGVRERIAQLGDELAIAPDGQGNATAARIAFMVGGYVGAGQVSESEAVGLLLDAISSWNYRNSSDARTMETTIRKQVSEGSRHPRAWEAPRFPTRVGPPAGGLFAEPKVQPKATVSVADDPLFVKPMGKVTDFFTDGGQGRFLAQRLPGVAYATGLGWLQWDGCRWKSVPEDAISAQARRLYAKEFSKAAHKFAETQDDKDEQLATGFKKCQDSGKLSAILKGLKDAVYREAKEFDAHPMLINTPNGIVDLRTGKLSPSDPTMLFTKVTAANYVPGCTHQDWESAKESLPAETLEWLQLRMGAAITGMQLADDALFLHGGGANGKSLFCNDGIVRALGEYAMIISSDVIASRKADASAASPEKADLRGARFVLIEELPEEFALSTKALKELTGTGAIRARRLYQDSITFDATHTLVVNTNHRPNVTDVDWGTWRRLTMVDFPYTFTSRPSDENERQGDPELTHRVRSNVSGQWSAILAWLVEGATRVLADKRPLQVGKTAKDDGRATTVISATQAWRGVSDRIMGYATDCLVRDPNGAIAKTDLIWHFNCWLKVQGQSPWSSRLIALRMEGHPSFKGVMLSRPRAEVELSRPKQGWVSEALPTLPGRPEVFSGIRFA